jgi:hypothetical protein
MDRINGAWLGARGHCDDPAERTLEWVDGKQFRHQGLCGGLRLHPV